MPQGSRRLPTVVSRQLPAVSRRVASKFGVQHNTFLDDQHAEDQIKSLCQTDASSSAVQKLSSIGLLEMESLPLPVESCPLSLHSLDLAAARALHDFCYIYASVFARPPLCTVQWKEGAGRHYLDVVLCRVGVSTWEILKSLD